MYVTAHRVRSPDGEEAIHSFLHRHDTAEEPFPSDPALVPESAPGRLVWRNRSSLPAGGNTVLSYIDLILPDDAWTTEWVAALAAFAAELPPSGLPVRAELDGLTLIFGGTAAFNDADEYRQLLVQALLAIEQGYQ